MPMTLCGPVLNPANPIGDPELLCFKYGTVFDVFESMQGEI